MWVLYQQQSVPQHPWASRSQFTSDTKSAEITKTPQGEGLLPKDCSYFKCWSWVLWSLNTCGLLATKLEVPWPTSKFNNLFEPLTELRKALYLLSSVIIKHETQGQRNGEEAWGKWGSKAAKPPNPLRTLPFTNPWCYHLLWSSLNPICMGFNWGLEVGNLIELAIGDWTQYQYPLVPRGTRVDSS